MSRILTPTKQYIPADLVALNQRITPEIFWQLCRRHRDLRLELTSTGELIVMPPAGSETGMHDADLTYQLTLWAKKDGTGVCFGSSAGFTLPNGAIRSPDASWIKRERWERLTARQKKRFAPICPDFAIELRSETDRLAQLCSKMLEYIANGATMAWLIDPLTRRVHVYRANEEPAILENPKTVSGDPLLPGFVLHTEEIL